MKNVAPKFNYRDVHKWRCIDLRTTAKIAHMCTSGVDFQGCSKSHIIEEVARPIGFTSNADKFVAMMDETAKFLPRLKRDFDSLLADKLAILNSELNKNAPQLKKKPGPRQWVTGPCSCCGNEFEHYEGVEECRACSGGWETKKGSCQ